MEVFDLGGIQLSTLQELRAKSRAPAVLGPKRLQVLGTKLL